MKTSDFNFILPDELIARYPLNHRSESRLLCLNQNRGINHHIFSELPTLLNDDDVLIFNNTRVIPARLYAQKKTGGKVEILVERILENAMAYAHVKANKSLKLPCTVVLQNEVEVTILERSDSLFKLQFHTDQCLQDLLSEVGTIPLPGYLQRQAEEIDKDRYQTVYAAQSGAVAAPTAGLHFDQLLLNELQQRGIKFGFITLHVGAGTFKPVMVEQIEDHKMHHEIFEIPPDVCELVNECKTKNGRIIAVGTTAVRALESAMQGKDNLEPCSGETNIFIYPGYHFRCVDSLITNFHLPRSTLLMLVCAFGGYEEVMTTYQAAISSGYRFYSYGDAMFIRNNS
ncbi:MAG: tRNA preQ1(34) S-adenosylmethionine ribosyltransferase-isomerase QueA [Gammaproteobacteria bacterium]|nr:tRNA preQ1(34) S-adenosylmethionine ribosyltransferase-isomerase QueA [Gammaproteobacteria bacterium]